MNIDPVFHATSASRCKKIIQNNRMEKSIGDRHWLDDGSYFYNEDLYAYNWMKIMYRNYYKRDPKNDVELLKSYPVIVGVIETDSDRVFNLDRTEHKIVYDCAFEQCTRKMKYSKKFKGNSESGFSKIHIENPCF